MKVLNYKIAVLFFLIILIPQISLNSENKAKLSDIPDIPLPNNFSQKRLYIKMNAKKQFIHSGHNKSQSQNYRNNLSNEEKSSSKSDQKYIFPYIQDDINTETTENKSAPLNLKQKPAPKNKKGIQNKKDFLSKTRNNRSLPSNANVKKIQKEKYFVKQEIKYNKRKLNKNSFRESQNKKSRQYKKLLAESRSKNNQNKDIEYERTWRKLLKNSKPVPGFSISIEPLPRGPYRYKAPEYYRGIYLNNSTARSSKKFKALLKRSKKFGINVLVIDVYPRMPSPATMKLARESGFYLVSRVVVFPGGLKSYPPSKKYIDRIASQATRSAEAGFMEVQLDYIRFTDYWKGKPLSKRQRYRTVTTVIKYIAQKVKPYGVRIGADVFGRIPFNKHDRIGQNMEVFAQHLETIYPMLYPSHFYGDKRMQNKPYLPVYHGTKKSVERVGHKSKIIPYIQAFRIHVKPTKLSYKEYIYQQLLAARDSGGSGFIAWNAGNHYSTFFSALKKLDASLKKQKL